MILGVGIDIVSISRIEAAFSRFENRFRERIFTEAELELAERMYLPMGALAKRWAAKEACSKALGTGMRQGVAWRNIEVKTNKVGMPALNLSGIAEKRLIQMTPEGYVIKTHLTMTDDLPWAAAVVILEGIPRYT